MRYGPCYCDIKLDNEGIEILNRFLENSDLTLTDSVLGDQKHSDVSKNIRSSKNAWIKDSEFCQFFNQICSDVNRMSGWNLGIDGGDYVQYGVYDVGDYYGWHADQLDHIQEFDKIKCIRKISVTLMLSGPDEYEGGELDLELYKPDEDKRIESFKLEKYEAIFFQSDVWHRVRPVKSGIRKSLVTWFYGPPYV